MTLSKTLYNIISGFSSVPDICVGPNSELSDPKQGLMRLTLLPSSGNRFGYRSSLSSYQIDIWHSDIYACEDYMEETISYLIGYACVVDGVPIKISLSSNLGGIEEEVGELFRYSIIVDIAWVRPAIGN